MKTIKQRHWVRWWKKYAGVMEDNSISVRLKELGSWLFREKIWLTGCLTLQTKLIFVHDFLDNLFCDRFYLLLFIYFLKDFIYSFLERGEEKERNISVWLPLTHPVLGTWPETQACTLTVNRTSDPLVPSPHSIHWAIPARALTYFK